MEVFTSAQEPFSLRPRIWKEILPAAMAASIAASAASREEKSKTRSCSGA